MEVTACLDTTTFVEVSCHDEKVAPRDDDDVDGAEGASAREFMNIALSFDAAK